MKNECELAVKIENGGIPIAGASVEGTNPCDGSRVVLEVRLSQKVEDDK